VLYVARITDLGGIEVDDLACAVSEAVTNGICHGRPPISTPRRSPPTDRPPF
jgi:anti-sigma regulatory factor (Ser/Thr protein kinase)